ncbi:MAG: efflux RND transporter permease subunit [Bacteroidota bacterium]
MRTWFAYIADFIIAFPKSLLASLLLLLALSVYPASQITTNFDLEGFFPQDDTVIHDYERLADEFGRDDNVILVGFRSDSLFSTLVLNNLRTMAQQAEEISYIDQVRSIWNVHQISSENQSLRFDPFLSPDTNLDTVDLEQLRASMLDNPFIQGRLLSEDAQTAAFTLEIADGHNHYFDRQQIINELNTILDQFRNGYEFHITGIPYFRNQYVSLLNTEIVLYVSVSTLLIILLLWALYRSFWGVLLPIAIVWATILMTVAFMALTGGFFEILSSTISPILLCVGVADSIHLMSKYDDHEHQALRPSVKDTLVTLGSATFLTSVTTAIGFVTLYSSSVMPMKRFGLYTAAGVLIAYIITMIALPSIIQLFEIKRFNAKARSNRSFDTIFKILLNRMFRYVRNHQKQVFLITAILLLAAGYGMTRLEINGRVFDDIGQDSKLIADSRFFSKNLSPPFPMELILTPKQGSVKNAQWLHQVDQFESFIRSHSEVHSVTSLNTLIKEMDRVLNESQSGQIPSSGPLISQYLLLLELNNDEMLNSFVDFDYRTLRISTQLYDVGSKEINLLRDDLQKYADQQLSDTDITITGTTVLSAAINDKMVTALASSIGLAFIGISIIMALLFRTAKLVIISLLPNILPLIIIAGIMGYLNIHIKPSTAVIFTIAFGIAVDDTIHYLARFRIEYLRSGNFVNALQKTTVYTGKAIFITSMILVVGFGSLVFSEFHSTMLMGILVCSTIAVALFADLLLLPALFLSLRPKIAGNRPVSEIEGKQTTWNQASTTSNDLPHYPKSFDGPSAWEESHQS